MNIEEGKFYFIKNSYFDLFKEKNLMLNKENGNKRPCYLCFKDEEDDSIIWFVPISHKVEKYKEIYKQKRKRHKTVLNFVFGKVLGSEKVFLIQNIFPVTIDYIDEKYINNNKDVEVSYELKEKIIYYSKELIRLTLKRGNIIAFNDILEMKNILLNNELVTN